MNFLQALFMWDRFMIIISFKQPVESTYYHNNLELMISLFIQSLDKIKIIPKKVFFVSKVTIKFVGILVEIALLRTYCNKNKYLLIKSNKNLIKSKGIIVDNCNWLHPF